MKTSLAIIKDRSVNGFPRSVLYVRGANVLHFATCYEHIRNLRSSQGCTHTLKDAPHCHPCEFAFYNAFWTAARLLLDYFADFYHLDPAHMHALWFEMLDGWQESLSFYNNALAFNGHGASTSYYNLKALRFMKRVDTARRVLNHLLNGLYGTYTMQEPIIHVPCGKYLASGHIWNHGPYLSGMKPWHQFLNLGAPGSTLRDTSEPTTTHSPDDDEEEDHASKPAAARILPHPAVAILYAHDRRFRHRTQRHNFRARAPVPLSRRLIPVNPKPNTLYTRVLRDLHYATTHIHSLHLTLRYVNGAPPISRPPPAADSDAFDDVDHRFHVLDQFVFKARRQKRYRGVKWGVPVREVSAVEEQSSSEDGGVEPSGGWEEGFDLLVVKGVHGGLFGEMFDLWEL